MLGMRILCLFTVTCLFGAVVSPDAQRERDRPVVGRGASVISVRVTDPVHVVFVEHKGAYWTVGPAFTRVAEYMRVHDRSGLTYVRYARAPYRGGSGDLASQVGFIVRGTHDAQAPFQNGVWASERVAEMVVEGPTPSLRHEYKMMYDWIERNEHEPAGPVTEVYHLSSRAGNTVMDRVALRVTLHRPKPRAEKTDDDEPERTSAAEEPVSARRPSEIPVQPERHRTDSHDHREIHSVNELVKAGRFDRLAEYVVPDEITRFPAVHVWFGQVVFRVRAAARGVEQRHPGEGRVMSALAESLVQRYRSIPAGAHLDPLLDPVVQVEWEGDPRGRRRHEIMRNLDAVLGRIGLDTLGADAALAEVESLLQQIIDLNQS